MKKTNQNRAGSIQPLLGDSMIHFLKKLKFQFHSIPFIFSLIAIISLISCATSPKGRKQFLFMSENQMAQMGLQSFDQMKKQIPIERDSRTNDYVKCIINPLLKVAGPVEGVSNWEIVVFQDKAANAFALPGGRIGVYTGILKVANTPDQLAAVIGHEIGHVMAKHGNERVSETFGINALITVAGITAQKKKKEYGLMVAALGGAAAQYGVLLPHSRTQESEADLIGLDLMAQAGFDPRESIKLWENMAKAGGSEPIEFLSTHPSHGTRIKNLKSNIPKAMPFYLKRKEKGSLPSCSL